MFKWIKHSLLLFLIAFAIDGKAQVFNIVVDKNGKGDFTTLQSAINSVPNYLTERTLIFVKRGIYTEKVVISSSKTNLSIIGENAEKVVISWDDYQGKGNISGANSYTLWADSPGLYAENITIENTAGNVGQAVALRTTGDTMVFKNCRFLGFQDTYYAHKNRQYNLNCYVEGATDFVYGDATAVFDSCNINCVKGGQYISAPADAKLITNVAGTTFLHGLLFRYCNVTSNSDVAVNSFYLGRPWQPNSSSVFIECKLGSHIKPEGWSTWGATNNHLSSVFAEYKNINPDGTLADVSTRISWSSQLDDAAVTNLYKLDFFLRKNFVKWYPKQLTQELAAPENMKVYSNELTWNKVDNAIGYIVLANDSVIGMTKSNSFSVLGLNEGNTKFDLQSVNKNGNLSKKSSEITTGIIRLPNEKAAIEIIQSNGFIYFSEEVNCKIFNTNGALIRMGKCTEMNVDAFRKGIYFIHVTGNNGNITTKKIVL